MIADTQEGNKVSPDTLALINASLDEAKPDLVVYSGDQIWGKRNFNGDKNEVERVKNSKEDHSLVESVNFLERFWKYYSDKDLSEIDKCGLKARIKEGVTFLSKFNF